ncbi:MAG TPA: oxygenase MpaB family protein [Acidimicrobiales bacterium]|nr:oxygenase MpaB family protein [Acidimicrobiales bacterium]
MVSLPSLGALPVVGGVLRQQLMAPIAASLSVDRLPFEQYTDPPGDPGLFGPGSATWRVHADPAMLIGGLAALLLQTLHPLAMAGVADHSNYRSDPLGRLSRTGSFVTGTTYGSTETAERLIKLVKGLHRKVHGTAPDGRPYSASDPDLVTWVHTTEVANFLKAHQRYNPFPVRGDQADRYVHEMAVIAERLGGERIPRSRVAVRAYFRRVQPELEAGEQCRDAVGFLTRPMSSRANPAMAGAHRVVVQAAVGLLPGWAREMLDLPRPSLVDLAMAGPAAVALLTTLRLAAGEAPLIAEARRRCAAEPDLPEAV